jgi:hypothetical protein
MIEEHLQLSPTVQIEGLELVAIQEEAKSE